MNSTDDSPNEAPKMVPKTPMKRASFSLKNRVMTDDTVPLSVHMEEQPVKKVEAPPPPAPVEKSEPPKAVEEPEKAAVVEAPPVSTPARAPVSEPVTSVEPEKPAEAVVPEPPKTVAVDEPVKETVKPPAPAPKADPPVAGVKKKRTGPKILLFMLLGLLIAGLGVLSAQMYLQYRETEQKLAMVSPQMLVEATPPKKVFDQVARHMMLPDEQPQVTTVTEVEKFKVEPFYANAQNGDKVLVFSRRAILYRPSIDKIIEIGYIRPVSPTPTPPGGQAQDTQVTQASGSGTVAGETTEGATEEKTLIDNESPTDAPAQ